MRNAIFFYTLYSDVQSIIQTEIGVDTIHHSYIYIPTFICITRAKRNYAQQKRFVVCSTTINHIRFIHILVSPAFDWRIQNSDQMSVFLMLNLLCFFSHLLRMFTHKTFASNGSCPHFCFSFWCLVVGILMINCWFYCTLNVADSVNEKKKNIKIMTITTTKWTHENL